MERKEDPEPAGGWGGGPQSKADWGVFGLAGPRRLMELGDRLVMFHYVRVCLG